LPTATFPMRRAMRWACGRAIAPILPPN
jgi:hypothetical protein